MACKELTVYTLFSHIVEARYTFFSSGDLVVFMRGSREESGIGDLNPL